MKRSRVSICLPNLNTRRYLQERIDTVLRQTYDNWELIVSDNYSDDGAWPSFEELARADSRVSIAQAPREGMYANWNRCIERSTGDYIYIATSDDTMPPECLEKLVSALDDHPECDIAHCPLKPIDEHGNEVSKIAEWWSNQSVFAMSSGPLIDVPHIRRAPFDGLLHLAGRSVYVSITQLLIRRSLFDRIGLFQSTWGSVGDFNWSMRAGLAASAVHVPDTWGGWRLHAAQATANAGLQSVDHARRVDGMIADAIEGCSALLPPRLATRLQTRWSGEFEDVRAFDREIVTRPNSLERKAYVAQRLLAGSVAARRHVRARVLAKGPWLDLFPDRVRNWLHEAGMEPALLPAINVHSLGTGTH
jgi:glycosyltransferase involved in cell wall biosynthesis